ncbi:complex I NDUFA9 subunit family protein [Candidatus Pelagibacter communis]|uniref:complex I NDUFA9 subunit family protein n=1 Tax=Pelagibacter ubique TaxID=198252 RepID=UPI00094CBDF2|nr:complex I NDUFA9 subunit family protein [Candidatus Pelagibacter ubique]
MKAKNCLIFGGSGQIGRNLIRKLTKKNYQVTVVTRNIHQKSYIIKTQANAGYIDIVESNIFEEKKLRNLFEKADICVNLVGILFESKKGNTFKNIHTIFPSLLSKLSKQYKLKHFIHLSALGINEAIDSDYAKSKLEGEERILKNFPLGTIIRPSIVYSVDDNFTTNFMTLLSRLPIFPLYYKGKTKFAPIHCSDLTDVIFNVISNNINSKIIECVGPEIISFKEIIEKLLNLIGKKRLLIPIPLPIAQMSARFFEVMPKPLLTRDQLKLLKYDNVLSGNYKSNSDIGVPSLRYFDEEVKKYCYMWREGGQFSTEKYNSDNIDIKTS